MATFVRLIALDEDLVVNGFLFGCRAYHPEHIESRLRPRVCRAKPDTVLFHGPRHETLYLEPRLIASILLTSVV